MITRPIQKSLIQGLSLIELMVALAISAILLLGVATIYTSSKRSYQINDQFSILQENSRYALHRLTKEIRMAGYTGCNFGTTTFNTISNNPSAEFARLVNNNNYITGHQYYNGAWTPALPTHTVEVGSGTNTIQTYADAITIRKASACSSSLSANATATSTLLPVGNCEFDADEELIITDCNNTNIFTSTDTPAEGAAYEKWEPIIIAHGASKNTPAAFNTTYDTSAFVMKAEVLTYFIGSNSRGGTSLYVDELGETTELIPNVENMAIQYGVDTNNDESIDTIQDAKDITNANWNNVISVYLHLLLYTDDVGTESKKYSFNGVTYDGTNGNAIPGDKRYRREFITAVNLRNRIH